MAMWVRSAFWLGKIRAGHEKQFIDAVDAELVPALSMLPGVLSVRSQWPRRLEDNPPQIACQILVEFAREADVDRMLASAARHALRARVREIAEWFDGSISHIDYEVGADAIAERTPL